MIDKNFINNNITDNQCLAKNLQKKLKNLLKKFANTKNSRTFVPGLRKRGSLSGINLLVISFSVINYVVSKSVRLRQADSLFFMPFSILPGGGSMQNSGCMGQN